jgi:hypothetical protein
MLSFLSILVACTQTPLVSVVDSHGVSIDLINPTEVDPFEGVEVLRLDVHDLNGRNMLSEERLVGEAFELDGITEYGVVRFTLTGTSLGNEVLSMGRSALVSITPRVERVVPITFLPVNKVLAITQDMFVSRSHHGAATLPDGRVALFGGIDLDSSSSTAAIEYYDPDFGWFVASSTTLGFSVYTPRWDWNDEGEIVVAGGAAFIGGELVPQAATAAFDPLRDTVESLSPMSNPRHGHCFKFLWGSFGVSIGGGAINSSDFDPTMTWRMESLRPEPGTGVWDWLDVDFSTSQNFRTIEVQECAALDDGRLFLTGWDNESTGVFDYANDGSPLPAAFETINESAQSANLLEYLVGPILIPLENSVWLGGGAHNSSSGPQISDNPREFNLDQMMFVNTPDINVAPRLFGSWEKWIDDDHYVLGCGFSDYSASVAQKKFEIVDLDGGIRRLEVNDMIARPGCRVNALNDGTILITGGYGQGSDAAILVPYF